MRRPDDNTKRDRAPLDGQTPNGTSSGRRSAPRRIATIRKMTQKPADTSSTSDATQIHGRRTVRKTRNRGRRPQRNDIDD